MDFKWSTICIDSLLSRPIFFRVTDFKNVWVHFCHFAKFAKKLLPKSILQCTLLSKQPVGNSRFKLFEEIFSKSSRSPELFFFKIVVNIFICFLENFLEKKERKSKSDHQIGILLLTCIYKYFLRLCFSDLF